MNEMREQFDDIVEKAVKDREHAMANLIDTLATDLMADPARFDPMRLRGLGPDGLRSLLAELDLEPGTENGEVQETAPVSPIDPTIKGWADKRRSEPWPWGRAVAMATLTGLALCIMAFAASALLLQPPI